MKLNTLFRIPLFLIAIVILMSCNSNSSTDSSNKNESNSIETKDENAPIVDSRFKVDTTLLERKVKLILNRKDVPIGSYTDFYLKIENADPQSITISTDVKQAFVSNNKEPFYYGIKGIEGATQINMAIYEMGEGDTRNKLGNIVLPVELKK